VHQPLLQTPLLLLPLQQLLPLSLALLSQLH
jgi:hypothetical protein